MQNNLKEKAVEAAIQGNWESAIEFNQLIIKEEASNIPALNRLGRAYLEVGKLDESQRIFKQVLNLDKYNPIAKKNLNRIKTKQKNKSSNNIPTPPIKVNFLEEPGKTKTSQLVRLSNADVISNLYIGQPLLLDLRKRLVCVKTENNIHVGSLPDDLCFRLSKLIRLGNKYEVLIKSIEGHTIQVFIRETKRSNRLNNIPSFPAPPSSSYHAGIRHVSLNQEPLDTRETGEDSD